MHGIRGEVLIHSYAEVPEDLGAYGPLSDAAGARSFAIESARAHDGGRGGAARGRRLSQCGRSAQGHGAPPDRDHLPDAGEDAFYQADLIGLEAVDAEGNTIGTIVAAPNFGAGDLPEIRLAGTSRTELVPFMEATVPYVHIAASRALVALPPTTRDEESKATPSPGLPSVDQHEVAGPQRTPGHAGRGSA